MEASSSDEALDQLIYDHRKQMIDLAALVPGITLSSDAFPVDAGLVFMYEPPNEDWPQIAIVRMIWNWRIAEVEIPGYTYGPRYWCYRGTDTRVFLQAATALAEWKGDPQSEPQNWIKAWDGRRADDPFSVKAY